MPEQQFKEPNNKQALLAVKDAYTFDFLDLAELHSESELEQQLVKNIRKFLLEMGNNYTFVGNQYRIQVGERDYWVDLLLYHRKLLGIHSQKVGNSNSSPNQYSS
jgi:predicted nuclease of restriction endonuclease-like (RecB) superfamily